MFTFVISTLCLIKLADVAHIGVTLDVKLLPDDERYDLQLKCTASLPPLRPRIYPHSFWFFNNRSPDDVKNIPIRSDVKFDLFKCEVVSALAFGRRTWSNCSMSGSDFTLDIKIGRATEQYLSTWTCGFHFIDVRHDHYFKSRSSVAYLDAAVTAFEDRPLKIGAITVVPVKVTSTGNVVLGCQIDGLNTTLHVRDGSMRGVPLKDVHFRVGNATYTGELYGRRSSKEIATCGVQSDPAVSCFLPYVYRHDDFACKGHSFTLLTEISPENVAVYEPPDVSPSFVFSTNGGEFTVTLTEYLVVENPPRSVSCYGIAGRPREHVCLSERKIAKLTGRLLTCAVQYSLMSVNLVAGPLLECQSGIVVTVLSLDCINSTSSRHCDDNAGFDVVHSMHSIQLREDYANNSCVISHYYCFNKPRVSNRTVHVYVMPQQKLFDYNQRFVTSDDVHPNCAPAHIVKTARSFAIGYAAALASQATDNATTDLKLTVLTSPVLTCPCVQIPRTCPGTFPIVSTIVLERGSYDTDTAVTCTVFEKTSATIAMSDLLKKLVCNATAGSDHRFLPPPVPKLQYGVTSDVFGVVSRERVLLNCISTLDDCRSSSSEIEMSLVHRNWTAIDDDEVHRERHGLAVEPTLFSSRYDAVQCRWKNSTWGRIVDVEDVLGSYGRLACRENETYHIDIEMINDTAVQCVLSYLDAVEGCPPVYKLMFANSSCVGLACTHGGHTVSLALYDQDLSNNSTAYECYAVLQTSNFRPFLATKTVKQMKSTEYECDFVNLQPVILQHTFKSGDVHLACRYPMDVGDVRHCRSGVRRSVIQIEIEKVTAKNSNVTGAAHERKQLVTRIVYILRADRTVHVYVAGDLREFVQSYGYTIPRKNVMSVSISRKFFDTVTGYGAAGVAVYAHCAFPYDSYTIRSREIGLSRATIKAYQRAKINRYYPTFSFFPIFEQPLKLVVTFTKRPYHTTLVFALAIGFAAIFVVTTMIIAVITAPNYRI